jgi:putative ATP-dependent endonuclease of OLD family
MANKAGKGWFAILLGGKLQYNTFIPEYLLDAIFFAHPSFSKGVWANIIGHRLKEIAKNDHDSDNQLPIMKEALREFVRGDIKFPELRKTMRESFPDDLVIPIMDRF